MKEGTSALLLPSGLDENGGPIPWNVTVIWETFKTFYPTGKHLTNGILENYSVGQ